MLVYVFDVIETFRGPFLEALTPSEIALFTAVTRCELSEAERSRYLVAVREFPQYELWLRERLDRGDSVAVVGEGAKRMRERFLDPLKFWETQAPGRDFNVWLAVVPHLADGFENAVTVDWQLVLPKARHAFVESAEGQLRNLFLIPPGADVRETSRATGVTWYSSLRAENGIRVHFCNNPYYPGSQTTTFLMRHGDFDDFSPPRLVDIHREYYAQYGFKTFFINLHWNEGFEVYKATTSQYISQEAVSSGHVIEIQLIDEPSLHIGYSYLKIPLVKEYQSSLASDYCQIQSAALPGDLA